jgi:hypothetical protein
MHDVEFLAFGRRRWGYSKSCSFKPYLISNLGGKPMFFGDWGFA